MGLVSLMRWFNRTCPWHQPKRSVAKRAWRAMGEPAGMTSYDGIHGAHRMNLDLADPYERGIYFHVNNMVVAPLVRRLLRPGDVFVDGGANLGLLTLLGAEAVGASGHVHAFEPQPGILDRLREHVRANGYDDRVTIYPKACWHTQETLQFNVYAKSDAGSLVDVHPAPAVQSVPVETVALDSVVPGPVRLLKLDVEGAEMAALRGARHLLASTPAPHILLELNGPAATACGYTPMDLVDFVLTDRPTDRLHYLTFKSQHREDRDGVARRLAAKPHKPVNLWIEPCAS